MQIPNISNPVLRRRRAIISSSGRSRSHSLSSRTSRARRNDVSILSTRPSMRWFLPPSCSSYCCDLTRSDSDSESVVVLCTIQSSDHTCVGDHTYFYVCVRALMCKVVSHFVAALDRQTVGCKIKRGRHGRCTGGRSPAPVPVIGDELWQRGLRVEYIRTTVRYGNLHALNCMEVSY